jgi:glycylpeptide N-tetradecanoyltransferase
MDSSLLLPNDYIWRFFDVTNFEECKEIADFLKYNYVEDNKNQYRFNYTGNFIFWYLNSLKSKAIGIMNNDVLIGFISSRYIKISLNKNIEDLVEIDFLCIKKNTRNNKLCPILIQEITRLSNLDGVFEAIFTSENRYYNQLSRVKYYSRMINIKHLYDIKYIKSNNTLNELDNYYSLPKIKGSKQLIKLNKHNDNYNNDNYNNDNYNKCYELYNKYVIKFPVHELFTKEAFINSFNNEHIRTYVLVDNNNILDFISYYYINISLIENPDENMKDGYLYYYTNTSNNLHKMFQLLLYKLKEDNIDSFLALNIMDTESSMLEELKFIEDSSDFGYFLFKNKDLKIQPYKLAKILF